MLTEQRGIRLQSGFSTSIALGPTPCAVMKPRVLMIGAGRFGHGGIDAVISAYANSPIWNVHGCKWLETYQDLGFVGKLWVAAKALLSAPFAMRGRDIVHIHADFRASLLRKSVFLLLAKAMRKKVVLHIHAFDTEYLNRAGPHSFAWRVLRAADTVVALSPMWANILRETGAQVVVIPNPVILPQQSIKTICDDNHCPTVLYMGKVESRKGYQDLIRSMPIVIQSVPDAKLRIAGHGEVASAEALARELGVAQSVEFMGRVCNEDRERAYRSADVFCLPSYYEGVPMAILEAMAFRLPVVCTPVGGLPDLIKQGQNGIFVRPGKPIELAAAIISLLGSPRSRATIGEAAYKTVEETCSLELVARQLDKLYSTLVEVHEPKSRTSLWRRAAGAKGKASDA